MACLGVRVSLKRQKSFSFLWSELTVVRSDLKPKGAGRFVLYDRRSRLSINNTADISMGACLVIPTHTVLTTV